MRTKLTVIFIHKVGSTARSLCRDADATLCGNCQSRRGQGGHGAGRSKQTSSEESKGEQTRRKLTHSDLYVSWPKALGRGQKRRLSNIWDWDWVWNWLFGNQTQIATRVLKSKSKFNKKTRNKIRKQKQQQQSFLFKFFFESFTILSSHSSWSTMERTAVPRGKRPRVQVSMNDKERAIARIRKGETKAGISRELGVPESTVRGWVKRADQRIAREAVEGELKLCLKSSLHLSLHRSPL